MCLVRAPVQMRQCHKMAASNDAGARIHKSSVRGCAGAGGGQQVAFNGGTAYTTKCRNTAPPAPSTAYRRRLCAHCAQHTGAPPPPAPLGPSGLPRVLYTPNFTTKTAVNGSEDGRTSSTALKLGKAVPGEPGGAFLSQSCL